MKFLSPLRCALWFAFLTGSSLFADRIVLVAGGADDRVDIPALQARLKEPFGVAFDSNNNLLIVEMVSGNRLLKIDATGRLTHLAGQNAPGDAGDGGPALSAQFNGPHSLVVLPNDDVILGDTWNGRLRRINAKTGVLTTEPGFVTPKEKVRSAGPFCIALNPAGTEVIISDLNRVHALELKTGRLRLIAGNGTKGVPADGAVATEAPLVDPRAAVVDRKGNVYILERNGHALRVVDPAGRIRTVVNASGRKGGDGDGGDALAATMSGPKHLCIDHDDNVIIADAENHLVRKYIPATGKIVRVAGTGKPGTAGLGGTPEQCELNRPHGVTVARDGTLYITDSYNNRILKIVR